MKTKTKIIVGVAVAVVIGLFAYNKMNAEELSNNFSLGYNSELSFRGTAANTSAVQSSLEVGTNIFGLDFSIGALANIKDVGENETQLSLETGVKLLDSIQTSVGVVNYNNNSLLGDETEGYIDIGAEIVLSPNMRVYYNPSENDVTVEGSISHALNVTEEISVEAIASAGNTPVGEERATYYGVDIIASYSLGENTRLYVGFDLTELKDVNLEAPEVGVYGGITHRF